MDLDFSSLGALGVQWKIDHGEELTDEDREILRVAEEQEKLREEQKKQLARNHEIRQARMKDAAIEDATNKYCPLLERYCKGEECAWFKVLKSNRPDLHNYYHYDAMCAIQYPMLDTHVERED